MSRKILAALSMGLLIHSLQAQEADTTKLKEVVVSSQRTETTVDKTARNVTIITREEIQAAPVQSIAELLEYAVNIDVRQRGQFGVQSDVSIRGGSFDQTLILLNGVKMTDPQTGHHNMNLPVDLDQIERIEILQGGGSRVFGPNAFAGAINIITKKKGENQIGVGLTGGEYGLFEGRVHVTANTGKWNHMIAYTKRESDGYTANTDFEWQNLFFQTATKRKHHNFMLNLGWNQKAFGASTFYSSSYPNQFEETQTQFASVVDEITLTPRLKITPRVYFRRHYDRFELYREGGDYYQRIGDSLFVMGTDTAGSWYTGHNYHKTDAFGAELNATYSSKLGKTSIGADFRNVQIWSNVLGEPLSDPIHVDGEHSTAYYTRSADRQNVSIYAEHSFTYKKFAVSAGAMYNINSDFDNEIFPGVDVAYQLTRNFRPYASYNRSVRFPTYTDLYYNRGGAVGSIDLKPEESDNYEVGMKLFSKYVNGNIALFRREGKNLIDWIRYNGSTTTQASNITSVNINGVEADATFNLKNWLGEESIFEMMRLSYTYMDADTTSRDFESNYVLDFLQHKFSASLQHRVSEKISLSWNATYQERLGGYYSVDEGQEVEFEPVFLLDARVTHRSKYFDLFFEVANMFDRTYVDLGNIPQPGRWMRAGISFNTSFGKK